MSTTTKQQNTVPKLRFSQFVNDWRITNVADVLTIRSGKDHKYLSEGDIPVFGTGGLMRYANEYLYDGKTVFIGRKGTINKPFYYEGKFWTVDTLFYTNNFNGLTPEFTYFLFCNINWLKYNEASGLPSLSRTTIGTIPVTLPDLDEQTKIADFLGSVDAWLDNLRSQKTALEAYKRGMMQKLFTQQVRFKDNNGKDYPVWNNFIMSDIGDSYSGLTGKSGDDFGQGEPFITYKQIFDSSVIDSDKFSHVTVGANEKQARAQYGDILFTISSETPSEVGYSSVVLTKTNPYLNSFSFGLRPKSLQVLLPEFARYHFRSAPFRRSVVKLAQGSTRYNISKVQFMKLGIELPSPGEQQKIADFLTAIDKTITAKAEEITQVEQWKKGLMQKMFV